MTKQHFELIARILDEFKERTSADEVSADIHAYLAENFATELAGTNPNFNRDRFLKAAGVTK
jgi:hypothetical protein